MRDLLVVVAMLSTFFIGNATGRCEEYWIKAYGGGGEDSISVVRQTSDGGFIASGNSSSFVPGGAEIMVMKLDNGGTINWQKTYALKEYTVFSCIQETSDGGYIVSGNASDTANRWDGNAWIFRLTGSGDIAWQKSYGENGYLIYSIQQTSDGGYIAAGEYAYGPVEQGIWILKLSGNGDVVWQKGFGNRVEGKSIRQTTDGGFVLLGRTTHVESKIIVMKLDSTGGVTWGKTYANMCNFSDPDIYPNSISQTGYLLTYSCGGNGTGLLDLFEDGSVDETMHYPRTAARFSAAQATADGGYIIAGMFEQDALLVKLGGYGNYVTWQKKYGGGDEDSAHSIQQAIDGGYVVGGSTGSFGTGGNDGWALKLDGNGAVPGCTITSHSAVSFSDLPSPWTIGSCCGESEVGPVAVTDTDCVPREISAAEQGICSYAIPDDMDGDGTLNYLDNCPLIPNGPALGICRWGTLIGASCTSDEVCGLNGDCYLNQEEYACICVSDFDCDLDADGSDAVKIKSHFGRYLLRNPCSNANPCNGDFNCDSDVDGSDVAQFKGAFGRFRCFAGALSSDDYTASCMSPCFNCVDEVYAYTCTY